MKPTNSAALLVAACLVISCAPVPTPLPAATPSRALSMVAAPSLPAPTAPPAVAMSTLPVPTTTASSLSAPRPVPQQTPAGEGVGEKIPGLPLEDMTFEQIKDLFAELTEERLPTLLEDMVTLQDPDSAHEVSVRALLFSRFLHVEDAEIAELRRTTLGEVDYIVPIPIEDPRAPVWYVEVSGITEPPGPPIISPEGAVQVCSGIRTVWLARRGGMPLGHQPRGPCMLRLKDGSIVPYPTPRPTRLHTVTATPGGPPIPIMPTLDPSAPAPPPTQTPTDTPVQTATP